jgi:hypothetical protein
VRKWRRFMGGDCACFAGLSKCEDASYPVKGYSFQSAPSQAAMAGEHFIANSLRQ